VWALSAVSFIAIVVLDLAVISRRKEPVTMRQATLWVCIHVGLATIFAAALSAVRAGRLAASPSPATSPSTA
jgi:hypothetical protein